MRARLAAALRRIADRLDHERSGWLYLGPHAARMWAEDWDSPEDAMYDTFPPTTTSTLGGVTVRYVGD